MFPRSRKAVRATDCLSAPTDRNAKNARSTERCVTGRTNRTKSTRFTTVSMAGGVYHNRYNAIGRMVWKKATVASAEMPVPPLTCEGVLLAAWWLVALGSCAYAFALGMGG